jgi:starch synthase
VPIEQASDGTGTPLDPDKFVADLAATLIEVVADPTGAKLMGHAGRLRAEMEFSWARIASQTTEIYESLA